MDRRRLLETETFTMAALFLTFVVTPDILKGFSDYTDAHRGRRTSEPQATVTH